MKCSNNEAGEGAFYIPGALMGQSREATEFEFQAELNHYLATQSDDALTK